MELEYVYPIYTSYLLFYLFNVLFEKFSTPLLNIILSSFSIKKKRKEKIDEAQVSTKMVGACNQNSH